jgi:hypothetical protein
MPMSVLMALPTMPSLWMFDVHLVPVEWIVIAQSDDDYVVSLTLFSLS